jgi:tRNA(His) guanylyltransferase
MANSKYQYVRHFESDPSLLPSTYIVVRIDGRGFHKLSNFYNFTKPNDMRALNLMNTAAVKTMTIIYDIVLAYGVSDEFSFMFSRDTELFERRRDKLVSTVVSTFTAAYVGLWGRFFEAVELDLEHLPTFDARAVVYPTRKSVRDYFSWRQVDCHINNLYNTTFWNMVLRVPREVAVAYETQGGKTLSQREAEEELKATVSADKNEILWSRFGVNYNDELEMFRKGSVVVREYADKSNGTVSEVASGAGPNSNGEASKTQKEKERKRKMKAEITVRHVDIIKDEFWDARPWLLGERGDG